MRGTTGRKIWITLSFAAALLVGCDESGRVQDEAMRAGRQPQSFPAAGEDPATGEDLFKAMDNGAGFSPDEVKGRNMWIVWTGGNDRFWDVMTIDSFGAFDLLKTLSSYPGLKFNRDNRWNYLGLVNEPCFEKASGPDPNRYGLWLDHRRADCRPDSFEDETKYPGVKIGARGNTVPVGSYYGYASGIVGLRLFPNPAFDEEAKKNWDADKFYTEPRYYQSKKLVRPYRVGMSCGFCHVGPSPIHPPADPENPQWENLNSTVGAQYFWFDRIFVWDADPTNFTFQLVHTSRPGALDTSLVSTDSIVNPRTMNAFYSLGARLELARRWGHEILAGPELNNKQFNDFVQSGPLAELYHKPEVQTPRVLKDGSDSVGALGALNRVYLNIGLFSEEWLLHFNAFVGGTPITPIEISVAEKNSSYWKATEAQTFLLAQFLLKAGQPDHLKDAPGGVQYLAASATVLDRGKEVFAERCARCHSSKLPTPAQGVDPGGCAGPHYLACWNRYWEWTKTDDFKQKTQAIVKAPDFLDGNYLSTELRVPLTLLQTNACSPLATNAIAGNIWDNFSSQSYKDLPSVGEITIYDPFTGEPRLYRMPAGGRGYTRPPSLISLWSTAPYLLNNTVGKFDPSPSVEARMRSFQIGIEQMLWPEKRDKDAVFHDKIPGSIDRTTATSWLSVPVGYLPEAFATFRTPLSRLLPGIFTSEGSVKIGPIPKDTPVDLIGNLDVLSDSTDPGERVAHAAQVAALLVQLKHDLEALGPNPTDDDARKVFAPLGRRLFELSKCPDYIVNRGHYFGTDRFAEEPGLNDDDKRALIEFLKTF
jgi:hypothetical protein